MTNDPPTVLLVTADDALHDEVVRVLVASGFVMSGRSRSARRAVDDARSSTPSLALLDVRVTGDVLGVVSVAYRERLTETVLLMVEVDEQLLADAITRGAAGVVAVDELRSLPASLRAVLVGEPALSRTLVARLLSEYRTRHTQGAADGPLALLSRRERDVLELLRRGRTTQEVARELFLQPVTVRSHVASAVHRLGVANRAEALRLLDGREKADGD